jgi:hypothetical protein
MAEEAETELHLNRLTIGRLKELYDTVPKLENQIRWLQKNNQTTHSEYLKFLIELYQRYEKQNEPDVEKRKKVCNDLLEYYDADYDTGGVEYIREDVLRTLKSLVKPCHKLNPLPPKQTQTIGVPLCGECKRMFTDGRGRHV